MTPGPRQIYPVLAAAIVLPLIIFLFLQAAYDYRAQTDAAESATLERARLIIDHVDDRLERTRGALAIVGTIRALDEQNWEEAYARVREIIALNPDWKAVRLIDLDARRQLFDSRESGPRPRALAATDDALLPAASGISVGGIEPEALGCVCVAITSTVEREGRPRFAFLLSLSATSFENYLLADAPVGGVSGVVDRRGRFIARTLNYEERVGKPATSFVTAAIAGGKSGIYRGTTFEGLQNYTAFYVSPATGWSAHVAVSTAVIDSPSRRWWIANVLAGGVSLGLASVLALFGVRMIAEQRRSSERLQLAQRAEAIGKLAGGVAHDFNNMLAIVIGSLDLAKRRLATGRDDISRCIDGALEGANRATLLTRKLLAFSRRQQLTPEAVDANALIANMRELFERTLEATIRIVIDLKAGLWLVHVDPGELENALVNLAVNARDAMPGGGKLTIATQNVPATARRDGQPPVDMVRISVTDTGVGMTPDVAARAFDPFFSTKPVGKGTGLGLSQIHGFVEQSGGRVSLQSAPGRGTTVEILLPRMEQDLQPARPAPAPLADAPVGSSREIILVVEDETQVRLTAVEALRELGYSVLHAPDAGAALDLIRAQPSLTLLFTDIVMPGMSGRALAAEAARLAPRVKVLFTTGYDREPESMPAGPVLRKPYSLDDLARSVRRTLDG